MESICKNIHLENCKAEGNIQTALEEDVNLAENKEDVEKILLQKGKVKVDEIKVASSHAFIKGKIVYNILYKTLENTNPLQSITGTLPFHEDIYMNGLETGDHVVAEGKLEDISVHIINSRKLNLRVLLLLHAISEDIKEESVCMDLEETDGINIQKQSFDIAEIVQDKRDIFRIRDEVELPKNMPNIANIVWKDMRIQSMSYKPVNGKVFLKGDLCLFVLYQPSALEGMEDRIPIQADLTWYETTMPFQGELECPESSENMILDMQVELGNETVDIRQDMDQENRMIGVDCSLDLTMHLYESKDMEYVADAYGVKHEVKCTYKQFNIKNMSQQKTESIILEESFDVIGENEELEKICYGSCLVHLEEKHINNMEQADIEFKTGQISVPGYLTAEVLYQCRDVDGNVQFRANMIDIPFTASIDIPKDGRKYQIYADAMLQHYSANQQGKGKVDVKAEISVYIRVYVEDDIALVSEIEINPLDYDRMKDLPGMLIYYVEKGDSLWQIGKKYYMDVDKIKELNHLKDETIKKGDKLLLMKEM